MTLTWCADTAAADWLTDSRTPAMQLILFGPVGFAAYARLRFIPDPTGPDQDEADVELPDDHPPDLVQASGALRRLADFTSTPENCYFCLWDGYSDVELSARGPWVELPHRRYALLRGSVHDIDDWAGRLGNGRSVPPPAFVWPADHAWCFVSDVDPHWAGIGAAPAAVEALLRTPGLDVVPARPAEPQPVY